MVPGMDKEGNNFCEMPDEGNLRHIFISKIINQEDGDNVIATINQLVFQQCQKKKMNIFLSLKLIDSYYDFNS